MKMPKFVVGVPVLEEDFYGRQEDLSAIRGSAWTWLCGQRRLGKTSILRRLESLAKSAGALPFFFDLMKVRDTARGDVLFSAFFRSFRSTLEPLGMSLRDFDDLEPPDRFGELLDRLAAQRKEVHFLWDEGERLIDIEKNDRGFVDCLRAQLVNRPGFRFVLAGSQALSKLYEYSLGTSSFLATYRWVPIKGLDDAASRALLRCQNTGGWESPLPDDVVQAAADWCGGHPYVLQELGARLGEVTRGQGSSANRQILEACQRDLTVNEQIRRIVLDDFEKLSPEQQKVMRCACGAAAASFLNVKLKPSDIVAQTGLAASAVTSAVDVLASYGYLDVSDGVRLRYRFYPPLLPAGPTSSGAAAKNVDRLADPRPSEKLDAFLCHASADKPVVRAIRDELQRNGLRVWFDEDEALVGDTLITKLHKALRDSTYVIVFLSPHLRGSAWAQEEYVTVLHDEITRGGARLLPVIVQDCTEEDIPEPIRKKRRVDGRVPEGIAELLRRLRAPAFAPVSTLRPVPA